MGTWAGGDVRALLRAGGLVPAGAGPPAGAVRARRYAHPALGTRPVVRLVPEAESAAEDRALELLGFQLADPGEPLARTRARAAGFPGWALANDPANAAQALSAARELEELGRQAGARPGATCEALEALGARLARATPHFLPAFYEQAGRIFLGADNPVQASVLFRRAREAERAHGLPVEEERRRQVFTEFAEAGALSTRDLEAYAGELAAALPPEAAYAAYRSLCVRRVEGGVPPWASMAGRLRRLAAAAGLDGEAEDQALVADLLRLPATARAAFGFWRASRPAVLALARCSAATRAALLDLLPVAPREGDRFPSWWLGLLQAAGALDAVVHPGQPDAEPAGGPSAWLTRLLEWSQTGGSDAADGLRRLLPRLAPRLRAEGRPVEMPAGAWSSDLALVDLALGLGIPLATPPPRSAIELHRWVRSPLAAVRPLRHVAADPACGPLLMGAMDRWLDTQPAEGLLAGPALVELLSRWLDHAALRMATGGLVQLSDDVARLERSLSPRALAVNEAARDQMAATDLAGALGRTLRGGLLDELGWPALEAAGADLGPLSRRGQSLHVAWPNVVLVDGSRAIVVGPEGPVLAHDLQLSATDRGRLAGCFYADGQLLVSWWGDGGLRAYWSGRPSHVFDPGSSPGGRPGGWLPAVSVAAPDGGRTSGGRAVHAGDTTLPPSQHLLADGAAFWRLVDGELREFDPVTGEGGPASLPGFLTASAASGRELLLARSWLLPLPPALAGNPLGGASGIAGFRVHRLPEPGGSFACEGVDGRAFAGTLQAHGRQALAEHAPVALVALPGDEGRPRPLSAGGSWVSLWSPDGRVELLRAQVGDRRPEAAPGTAVVLPPQCWACLRPRDPAGSAALRQLTDRVAAELLREAIADADLSAALQRVLPDVTHPELRAGVAAAARTAAGLARRLQDLGALHQRQAPLPSAPGDQQLLMALSGLLASRPVAWGTAAEAPGSPWAFGQVDAVARYFEQALATPRPSRDIMPAQYPATSVRWMDLVGRMGAVALRAASPATPDGARGPLLALLERWAGTPFARRPERFLVTRAAELDTQQRGPGSWLRWVQGRHYFLSPRELHVRPPRRTVIEGSASGTFSLLRGFERLSDRAAAGCWETPERLRRVVALTRARGGFPWRPEAVRELARRTGLTAAEAALILAGLPYPGDRRQDFLGRSGRELLGLKATEAAAAREALERIAPDDRAALLAAAVPDEPERLWDEGPDVERLAGEVVRRLGRRAGVPDELVVRARAALGPEVATPNALQAACDPDASPHLTRDGAWEILPSGELAMQDGEGGAVFEGELLASVACLLPWLFVALPVGDAVRARLPRLLELARERLANPALLLAGGWMALEHQGRPVLDLVPGEPYRRPSGARLATSREAGPLIVVQARRLLARAFVRPAAVGGPADGGLARMFDQVREPYEASRFLLGPGATAEAERVAHTPVPSGSYEANPALSAPDLVGEAGARLGLSEEGATVYLQVLALAEPTMRNLLTWNCWTHARLGRAVSENVARGLLVEGQRTRASRRFFLPGPWDARRPPDLPLEAWKLPLYEGAPLGRVLPLRPLHELFAEAWRRVQSGDVPGYGAGT